MSVNDLVMAEVAKLVPCKDCGGKGYKMKTVFPNSQEKVKCKSCEERFEKLIQRIKTEPEFKELREAIEKEVAKEEAEMIHNRLVSLRMLGHMIGEGLNKKRG